MVGGFGSQQLLFNFWHMIASGQNVFRNVLSYMQAGKSTYQTKRKAVCISLTSNGSR